MALRIRPALAELRRRKVFRVGAVYVAVGLGVLGAAELILEPLGLDAARPYIVILVLLIRRLVRGRTAPATVQPADPSDAAADPAGTDDPPQEP